MYFSARVQTSENDFKMYDFEANKYGSADPGPFDNTMAFSDVSIRAGNLFFSDLNNQSV